MKRIIKPIAVILLSILFSGCTLTIIRTDMYGNQVDLLEKYFIVESLERDPVIQDIFYIKSLELDGIVLLSHHSQGVRAVKRKKRFNAEMKKIADNYGYCCYYTMEIIPDVPYSYIYQIRFFKSEEEFDKWIERYKH